MPPFVLGTGGRKMKRHVDYNLAKSIHTVLCYWFMGINRMREVCPQCTGYHGRAVRECFLKEEHSEFIFEQLRELKYIREKKYFREGAGGMFLSYNYSGTYGRKLAQKFIRPRITFGSERTDSREFLLISQRNIHLG